MNAVNLSEAATSAWRSHHAAKRSGAVSLSKAYEKQARELTEARNAAVKATAAELNEARRERLEANTLAFAADDPQIRLWAKRAAAETGALLDREPDVMAAQAACITACRRFGVEPPKFRDSDTEAQTVAKLRRAACSKWWRRRGRVLVARRVELFEIRAAVVTKAAQVYASDAGCDRMRERRQSNRELLDTLTATNEAGDSYTLAELAELSTTNPVLRRNELMTRVHGLEDISETRRDRGLFVTLTAPSRFHAVNSKTNRRNPLWDGSSPRKAQAWLCEAWALIRARLHKEGIRLYGLRCVEPHHDGTPHWHLLLFAASRLHQLVRKTIFDVMLAEMPADAQQAADRKRYAVKIKTIRPEKGSATGYIAKYLAKNIDGHQLTMTWERGEDGSLNLTSRDPATAAERIRAWASIWGIRQFQFLGTPPVTWWRELRRVKDEHDDAVIEAARKAADAGDYAMHVQSVGGVCKARDDLALRTLRQPVTDDQGAVRLSAYGEPMADAIKGVEAFNGAHLISRVHEWIVSRAANDSAPWTRVDNCNHPPPPHWRNAA